MGDAHDAIGYEIKEALACRDCRDNPMLCSAHPRGGAVWRAVRKSIPTIMGADRRVSGQRGRRVSDVKMGDDLSGSYFCEKCKHWRLAK